MSYQNTPQSPWRCSGCGDAHTSKAHADICCESQCLDENAVAVQLKIRQRADAGLNKYGVTTERKDIDLRGWLQHLQEELLDAAVYIERAMKDLK